MNERMTTTNEEDLFAVEVKIYHGGSHGANGGRAKVNVFAANEEDAAAKAVAVFDHQGEWAKVSRVRRANDERRNADPAKERTKE